MIARAGDLITRPFVIIGVFVIAVLSLTSFFLIPPCQPRIPHERIHLRKITEHIIFSASRPHWSQKPGDFRRNSPTRTGAQISPPSRRGRDCQLDRSQPSGKGIVEWSFALASRRYNKNVSGSSAIISQWSRTVVPVTICLLRSFPQAG